MLIAETVGRIRRERLVKGKPIKEIARDLKISRNTVRKVLRSEKTSFSYQRAVQPELRLGRWKGDLERLLTENVEKAARERLTLIRLFEELRTLGYEGGYDAVRRYARSWSRDHAAQTAAVFVPLSFAPGEAYQFDWSHEIIVMNGTTVTVKVAHVRLCHSRMMFVRAYLQFAQTGVGGGENPRINGDESVPIVYQTPGGVRWVAVTGHRPKGRSVVAPSHRCRSSSIGWLIAPCKRWPSATAFGG
jgi:transcriptional regulator with XRE-family HTH domain